MDFLLMRGCRILPHSLITGQGTQMDQLQSRKVSRFKQPSRSLKYGVGKEIAGKIYVHRDYANRLGAVVAKAAKRLPDDFEYAVVKYDTRSGAISFIASLDFDTASEPTVGDVITVLSDGTTRRRSQRADPQIYHHKWLFVADDYAGFDVEVSKCRSATWLVLEDVDKSRIGTRSHWDEHVVPRISSSKTDTNAFDG